MAEIHTPAIWTVGHSNHPLDALLRLLEGERIEVVADVRSSPFSRFAPQYNREDLERSLRGAGLRYLFLGDSLGGRPAREEHYDAEGRALYWAMSAEPSFQAAIERLEAGARTHRVALLCAEATPRDCHRRLLVGKVLAERGIALRHILPGGSVELEREVKLTAPDDQATLFGDPGPPWRSTQSVSPRRRQRASLAA
jgi:uncharacterized protein (DUF488 family)